jgi:hypothetical protein
MLISRNDGMNPVYQQAHDLVLGVLTQETAAPLTIFQEATLARDLWRVRFTIIGESHWIRIENEGRLVLQEVLACVPLKATECLHHHPCQNRQAHHFAWQNYQVDLHFGSDPRFPSSKTGLRVEFPQILGQTPFTALRWEEKADALHWWTLHTYPQVGQTVCVRTFSRFKF